MVNILQRKQTNINAPGGIRTQNLNRRTAEDLRLRPRSYWGRRSGLYISLYYHTNGTIFER